MKSRHNNDASTIAMNGSTHGIARDFVRGVLFFRSPRRSTATRREWCAFFSVAVMLCGAAYMMMGGVSALLQAVCDDDTLRGVLGDSWYYTVMDGGPTGFTAVALLLAVPFLVISVRRLRDAGLSPWCLLLPPALMAAAIALFLLYCICYNPGFVHSGDISNSDGTWLAVFFFALAVLSHAGTLILLGLMAFRKSRK